MESPARSQFTINNVVVLVFLTLIQFLTAIDTYAVDGVVPLIQSHFYISGSEVAIIRTASNAANTATLGAMWIAGEAVGRRSLYLLSLATWIVLTLLSIAIGSQSFLVFVSLRSLGAAASAVLGVLSPVLLADLFRGKALGIALMAMSACEVVSGVTISVIYSSLVVSSGLSWQAGLLPAPVLSLFPLVGLVCLLRKAQSGKGQRDKNIFAGAFKVFSIKSFCLISLSASLSLFHVKALLFWFPSMILSAWTFAPEAFMGLSYPSVTALNSLLILAGNVFGMPLLLWLAQSWHHGSGPFPFRLSGRKPFPSAYPTIVAAGAFINVAAFTFDVLILNTSFAACLLPNFLSGIGTSAEAGLGKLMILMVLPIASRTAGMSLFMLSVGIVSTPSAQIIGFIFDIFRGPSTLEEDRFHAFQKAMLCSNTFMLAGAIMFAAVVYFFEGDCKRAEKEDALNGGETDETTLLIGEPKSRAESLMYGVIRSRAPTVDIDI